MNTDESIAQIRKSIADGDEAAARMQVADLVSAVDDPMVLLTCASMYFTLDDEEGFQQVLSKLETSLPSDSESLCQIGKALLALDVPRNAYDVLSKAGDSADVLLPRASAEYALLRFDDALRSLEGMSGVDADILRMQVLAGLKRFDEAFEIAEPLVKEKNYKACRVYLVMLLRARRDKDALKFARDRAKDKTADGSAIMAQYQWICGNPTAAGAYASKAVKIDQGHVGAMEFLGYSLARKGAVRDAKIVAGAINEKDPGNPASFRIIMLCRGS